MPIIKTLGVVLIYISCSFKDQRHVKPLFPLSSCPTLAQKRKLASLAKKSHIFETMEAELRNRKSKTIWCIMSL